jgi:glyoxylate carboligase
MDTIILISDALNIATLLVEVVSEIDYAGIKEDWSQAVDAVKNGKNTVIEYFQTPDAETADTNQQ